MKTERRIDSIVQKFLGRIVDEPDKDDLYFKKYLENIENDIEIELIDFLRKIQIVASKKIDKYSLPYREEIIIKLPVESYLNGCFERDRIFRPILKELLAKDVFKIRFYLHVETYCNSTKLANFDAGIKYSFRYFIHDLK